MENLTARCISGNWEPNPESFCAKSESSQMTGKLFTFNPYRSTDIQISIVYHSLWYRLFVCIICAVPNDSIMLGYYFCLYCTEIPKILSSILAVLVLGATIITAMLAVLCLIRRGMNMLNTIVNIKLFTNHLKVFCAQKELTDCRKLNKITESQI